MSHLRLRHGLWLAVCDGKRALLLQNSGDQVYPKLETREAFKQDDPPTHEQGSSPPGRVFASGNRRAATEESDFHQQRIEHFLGMFAKDEEQQLRQRLADTIRYVVSQRLVSKVGGGRLMVSEIMGSSLRTRETLLYGESENRTFQEIIEAGDTMGWHSFDQSLLKAYKADQITDETALIFSTHKNKMRRDIEMVKKLRNMTFDEPSGLRLEAEPESPKVWSAA